MNCNLLNYHIFVGRIRRLRCSGICCQHSGQLQRQPLFHFNQHQQSRITAVLFRCLVKCHHMRMLCQPQRCLLLQICFRAHASRRHKTHVRGDRRQSTRPVPAWPAAASDRVNPKTIPVNNRRGAVSSPQTADIRANIFHRTFGI